MDPLARQAQRMAAGQELVPAQAPVPPGWKLTLIPGAPQAGSVGYRTQRFAHYISEVVADGSVVTQDPQVHDALMGLGVYQDTVNPTPKTIYPIGVLTDSPVSYWRLGESGTTRVAVDELGTQPPNLVTNPSFEGDFAGWSTPGNFRTNPGATLTIVSSQVFDGKQSLQVATTATLSEGADYAPINVVAGVTYSVSIYVKGNAGGEALQLLVGDGAVGNVGLSFTATTSWQRIQTLFTPTASGTTGFAVRTNTASVYTYFLDAAMVTVSGGVFLPYYKGRGGNDGDYTNGVATTLTNDVPNPNFERDTIGASPAAWVMSGSATVHAVQSGWASRGTRSVRVTSGAMGAGAQSELFVNAPTAIPGQGFTGWTCTPGKQMWVTGDFNILSLPTNSYAVLEIWWLNSAGAVLSGTQASLPLGLSTAAFLATAPANTAYVALSITWGNTTATAGVDFYVDSVLFNRDPIYASISPAYFDGDIPGCSWTGTAGNSTSTKPANWPLGAPGAISASGDSDTGMYTDGSSAYVRTTTPLQLPQFSLEAWYKPVASIDVQVKTIFGNFDNLGLVLRQDSGDLHLYSYNAGGGTFSDTAALGALATPGVFYHIVATYDGTTFRLYVNSALVASRAGTWNNPLSTWQVGGASGSAPAGNSQWGAVATIDEAAIYKYALSAAQIKNHYNLGILGHL